MAMTMDNGDVMNHLMFQKSLICDDETVDRESKLEHYIKMVNEMQQGTLVPSEDPFERSVGLVFELVIQQKFNPWDINLIEFSKMYMSRVKKATELNLILAGKLVYMAWEILRMQSELALQKADRPEMNEMMFDGWDPEHFDLLVDPFELGKGEVLLHTEELPIDEKVRRKSERPVTLIDLLDAFEEAKKESDIRLELAKFMQKYKRPEFDDKAHKESLEDDIARVWEKIQRFGGGAVPLSDLYNGSKEERVTVFVAMLFLARIGKVNVWQEKVPYGEIFLEVKVPFDIAQLEDASMAGKIQIEDAPVVK
ncbi:MAG TPA: segregation/condensation protein A [Thermoplasmata archaeon]|nr:segregation/condensation protein A [Thermoplasmata archaeon]